MKIINPTWQAANQSTDPLKARAKHRWWLKNREQARDYLNGTHKFEMCHNQDRTGEFRIMTGLEAKTLNSNHRQDYIDEINRVYPAHVSIPMKCWRVVEKFIEPEQQPSEQGEPSIELKKK